MTNLRSRLRETAFQLEVIDLMRGLSGDPQLGADQEHEMLQRELVDLEIADVDERIRTICQQAA